MSLCDDKLSVGALQRLRAAMFAFACRHMTTRAEARARIAEEINSRRRGER